MKNKNLYPIQAMTITIAAIFGVDILTMQTGMVKIAGRDGWISLLAGGIYTMVTSLLLYYLVKQFKDMDWPEIHIHLAGHIFGRILMAPVLIYTTLYTGLSVRVFIQALKMFLFDTTPIYAVSIFMILVVSYATYHGIEVIARLIDIIFPICMFTILALLLLSLQQVDISYIKPVMYENTANVIKGVIPGSVKFTGYGVIAYIMCYMKSNKGVLKWYLTGLIITIVTYTAFTVVAIMVFGGSGVLSLVFPTLTLTKSIEFPTTFLERLESFVTILWIGIVYMSLIAFNYISVRIAQVFFAVKEKYRGILVVIYIPILIFISLYIESGLKVLEIHNKLEYITIISLISLPLLIFLAWRKKKKGKLNNA